MQRSLIAIASMLAFAPNAAVAAGADPLEAWRSYARQAMTPDFDWARSAPAQRPSLLDGAQLPFGNRSVAGSTVEVSLLPQLRLSLANDPTGGRDWSAARLLSGGSAFNASYAATTLLQPLYGNTFSITAIAARQRFATHGFGAAPWESVEQVAGIAGGSVQEASEGSGVRIGLDRALNADLSMNVAVQSRLEMDAFKAYRGVYSEAGDFDVPGFAQAGVRWGVSSRLQVGFDVQRVFYSEVPTFTSAALPVRFLSLLGDGSSPTFAWRDLTIYGVEAAVFDPADGRWSLRYSTQQQPHPTSAILDRALSDHYSDSNWALGYQRDFGDLGRLQFAASYSPVSFFLGAAPYVQRDIDSGEQIEFEARWSLAF